MPKHTFKNHSVMSIHVCLTPPTDGHVNPAYIDCIDTRRRAAHSTPPRTPPTHTHTRTTQCQPNLFAFEVETHACVKVRKETEWMPEETADVKCSQR
mmetsp:Transcript_11143/g.32311  ORF Transcript_11143/g.32311 Transcript_11143/m.32311 type:complete len:97 (+) Transcript_11143:1894-2184(+)